MNSGTQAAKEAGNMVDLDSDPAKLLAVVEIGKQLLITRGALTTFSLANDVSKYFAIMPAVFAASHPGDGGAQRHAPVEPDQRGAGGADLQRADHPGADSARARAACASSPRSAEALLRRNMLVYGVGGMLLPFVAIKLIDLLLAVTIGA